MKVSNKLKVGTKLVWDCKTIDAHYYYPCMVVNTHDRLGALIAMPSNRQWMRDEQENLRVPTKEELNDFNYSKLDK